jgi:hypothetical protein
MLTTYRELKEDERCYAQQKYGHYCNYARSLGYEPITCTAFKGVRKHYKGIKEMTYTIHGGFKNENN